MSEHSIGHVAERTGVPDHVLRHWEDVGVLIPNRSASGHRRYSENDLDQALLIRRLQCAGLSLSEIRGLVEGDRAEREDIVAARVARLRVTVSDCEAAIDFLNHTRECRHRLIAACPACADFAVHPEPTRPPD